MESSGRKSLGGGDGGGGGGGGRSYIFTDACMALRGKNGLVWDRNVQALNEKQHAGRMGQPAEFYVLGWGLYTPGDNFTALTSLPEINRSFLTKHFSSTTLLSKLLR